MSGKALMSRTAATTVSSVFMAAVLLAGCSTAEKRDSSPYPDIPGSAKESECNASLAALIGGAIGAIVMEENRTRGAAVGAGFGALACAIINATTRQTKPPADVEHEYRTSHQGRLPEQPLVSVYDTAYNAQGSVQAGQVAHVVSNITVVPGATEPVREMREVLEIFDSTRPGEVMIKAEKSVDEAARAGGIQDTFNIQLPERMAEGNYPARTTLYVNNRRAGENRGTLRVQGRSGSV